MKRPVLFWASAALTVFLNGLLHGLVAGVPAAGAMLKAGKGLKDAAIIGLLTAAVNGGKRVLVWSDTNPFPNPIPGWITPPTDPATAIPAAPAGPSSP